MAPCSSEQPAWPRPVMFASALDQLDPNRQPGVCRHGSNATPRSLVYAACHFRALDFPLEILIVVLDRQCGSVSMMSSLRPSCGCMSCDTRLRNIVCTRGFLFHFGCPVCM